MSKEDTQKLEDVLKNAIRPLKELVEVLKNKAERQEFYLTGTSSDVKSIKEQQSVLNEKLDAQGRRLEILWEQVEKVTMGLEDVKETQDSHTTVLKRIEGKVDNNSDDTRKVNKRLIKAEGRLGIIPPPEFTLN